jgi:hypothetical protein
MDVATTGSLCLNFEKLNEVVKRSQIHELFPGQRESRVQHLLISSIGRTLQAADPQAHPSCTLDLIDYDQHSEEDNYVPKALLPEDELAPNRACQLLESSPTLECLLNLTPAGKKVATHLRENSLDVVLLKTRKYPYRSTVRWAYLIGEALENHRGMRLSYYNYNHNDENAHSIREKRREVLSSFWQCFSISGLPSCLSKYLWSDRISLSYDEPIALALSGRKLPSVQTGPFSNLPEQAQAALFSYAQAFAANKSSKPEKVLPETAIADILQEVSRESHVPLSQFQQVEISISSALNTAGINDRIDYVSAYLIIPPFPRTVHGYFDLEHSLVREIRGHVAARSPNMRGRMIDHDVRTALDALTVHFTNVDSIQTRLASLDLGTFSTTAGITGEAGASVPISPGAPLGVKVTPRFEKTVTEKLLKEIERRSVWLSPDRRMVRITQRGHEAITVAGTITETITLHMPRRTRLILHLNNQSDNSTDASPPISITKDQQPIYQAVDALVLLVGTARIAVPTRSWWLKEPNGYAFTVVSGPFRMRLWEYQHDKKFYRLDAYDLFPDLQRTESGKLAVMIRFPGGDYDFALFDPPEEHRTFLSQLGKSIGLQRVKPSSRGYVGKDEQEAWFRIINCSKPDVPAVLREVDENELGEKDVLIGLQDEDGTLRGFRPNEYGDINTASSPYCKDKLHAAPAI